MGISAGDALVRRDHVLVRLERARVDDAEQLIRADRRGPRQEVVVVAGVEPNHVGAHLLASVLMTWPLRSSMTAVG